MLIVDWLSLGVELLHTSSALIASPNSESASMRTFYDTLVEIVFLHCGYSDEAVGFGHRYSKLRPPHSYLNTAV